MNYEYPMWPRDRPTDTWNLMTTLTLVIIYTILDRIMTELERVITDMDKPVLTFTVPSCGVQMYSLCFRSLRKLDL